MAFTFINFFSLVLTFFHFLSLLPVAFFFDHFRSLSITFFHFWHSLSLAFFYFLSVSFTFFHFLSAPESSTPSWFVILSIINSGNRPRRTPFQVSSTWLLHVMSFTPGVNAEVSLVWTWMWWSVLMMSVKIQRVLPWGYKNRWELMRSWEHQKTKKTGCHFCHCLSLLFTFFHCCSLLSLSFIFVHQATLTVLTVCHFHSLFLNPPPLITNSSPTPHQLLTLPSNGVTRHFC